VLLPISRSGAFADQFVGAFADQLRSGAFADQFLGAFADQFR
jgi:hypothetical protein